MALTEIGAKLTLKDGARFRREAERAAGGLGKMADESERAHRGLSRLSKVAIGAGIAAGVGLAVVELRKFGKSSTSAYKGAVGDAMRLQRVLGGTIEQTSALAVGAQQSGVDIDTLGKSFGIFAKNLGAEGPVMMGITRAQDKLNEARGESVPKTKTAAAQAKLLSKHQDKLARLTRSLADAQAKLGVQVVDGNGKTRDQMAVLQDVAERFKTMPNGPNKTAMAMRLFGRAGAALIPMLNKGKKGFKDFQVEAKRLGLLMSNKDVKAVKDYTKAHRALKESTHALEISFGRELFPIMVEWEQSLVKVMPKIQDYARIALPALHDAVQKLVKGFEDGTGWGGRIKRALDGVVATADTLGKVLKNDVIPVVKWFADHPDAFKAAAVGVGVYKAAMIGAAFYTKSLAIWAPRAGAGVAASSAEAAAAGAAGGPWAILALSIAGAAAALYGFAKLQQTIGDHGDAAHTGYSDNYQSGDPNNPTPPVNSYPALTPGDGKTGIKIPPAPKKPPGTVTGKMLVGPSTYHGPVVGDATPLAHPAPIIIHSHVSLDGKEIAHNTIRHVQDKVARH